MKTESVIASLGVAEKRFASKVVEYYLLTMKSEGMPSLLQLVLEEGHSYDMFVRYSSGEDDSWVPKCDCRHIVPRLAFAVILDTRLHLKIGAGMNFHVGEMKAGFGKKLIFQTQGSFLDLANFAPTPKPMMVEAFPVTYDYKCGQYRNSLTGKFAGAERVVMSDDSES
jgi:hypothetical protein